MFTDWLLSQMHEKNLNQAELARRSGLTKQAITNYVGGRTPDEQALRKIAQGLRLPIEEVFRAAGLLPQNKNANADDERANHLIQSLKKPASKQRAIDYLQLLIEQEEREERENAAKKNHPATQPR